MISISFYRCLSIVLVFGCAGKSPATELSPTGGQVADTPSPESTSIEAQPTATALPAREDSAIFLWSEGMLYRTDLTSGLSTPVSEGTYDGYAFDRERDLMWMYRSILTDGAPPVQIEAVETTKGAQPVVFAEEISEEFTGVGIDRKIYVYGGNIMSEGYCYEDRLSASPCNMALAWRDPFILELTRGSEGWETTSGSVPGGGWLDSRPVLPEDNFIDAETTSIQPLPVSMDDVECECWGEVGACGSAVELKTGSLQLVTIGLGCGDMLYQSCGIYDTKSKGYYSFAGEDSGEPNPEGYIATLHPLDTEDFGQIYTSCALVEPPEGGWFATAEGMLCKLTDGGELYCRELGGHVAGWTPGFLVTEAPY